MRKPNYGFERAERARLKQAKRDQKARRHQERSADQPPDEAEQPPAAGNNEATRTEA